MTQSVETRLDGDTLVVRIPMRFQRRGRTRIVTPDGTLIEALARAWRWQKLPPGLDRYTARTAPVR